MAVFASILRRRLMEESPYPGCLDDRALLIVSHSSPNPQALRALFPDCEHAVVVALDGDCCDALAQSPWLESARWLERDCRIGLRSTESLANPDRHFRTVVFLHPFEQAGGRLLWSCRRLGVRRAVFDEGETWRAVSLAAALGAKVASRVIANRLTNAFPSLNRARAGVDSAPCGGSGPSAIPEQLGRDRPAGDEHVLRLMGNHIEAANKAPSRPLDPAPALTDFGASSSGGQSCAVRQPLEKTGVTQYIGALHAGGAERQLVTLARGLENRAWFSRVLTTQPMAQGGAHFRPLLEEANVRSDQAGSGSIQHYRSVLARCDRGTLKVLERIPASLREPVADLFADLVLERPGCLHCWLDEPNIIGGIAGLLADVPGIVLSVRNVGPRHFPDLYQPWMDDWYRVLARSERIHFIANSQAGARDYARWLGLPEERFRVVVNGVDIDTMGQPSQGQIDGFRASLGLAPGQPLVAGVFRLAPEKEPAVFLEVVRLLRQSLPNLVAAIAGTGPLETEMRRRIEQSGWDKESVRLLGRRRDVATLIAASDLVLLTSNQEGTPNCLLEAMWLERPIVATSPPGTRGIIEHGKTGLLAPTGDAVGLAREALRVLQNSSLRRRLVGNALAQARCRFSAEHMVTETIRFYHTNGIAVPSGPGSRADQLTAETHGQSRGDDLRVTIGRMPTATPKPRG